MHFFSSKISPQEKTRSKILEIEYCLRRSLLNVDILLLNFADVIDCFSRNSVDGWGNTISFFSFNNLIYIVSAGSDRQYGTDKDIIRKIEILESLSDADLSDFLAIKGEWIAIGSEVPGD